MELGEVERNVLSEESEIKILISCVMFVIFITYIGDFFAGEKMLDLYVEYVQTFSFPPFLFELIKTTTEAVLFL